VVLDPRFDATGTGACMRDKLGAAVPPLRDRSVAVLQRNDG
jgi:hypothetical protein